MTSELSRPGSRESAAVRKAFDQLGIRREVENVYGDADVVTVVYSPRDGPDDGTAHSNMMGLCATVLRHLTEKDLAPEILRGVCHHDDADAPIVWLVRREWATAIADGDLDHGEVYNRIVDTSLLTLEGS